MSGNSKSKTDIDAAKIAAILSHVASNQPLIASGGAVVNPTYMERHPVIYTVFETELVSISAFNAFASGSFSIMGFFISTAMSVYITGAFFVGSIPESAGYILYYGMPVSVVASVVSAIFGIASLYKKNESIQKIKREHGERRSPKEGTLPETMDSPTNPL